MDDDPLVVALEVDAVIEAAEAVQGAPVALDFTEVGTVERIEIIGKDLELGE